METFVIFWLYGWGVVLSFGALLSEDSARPPLSFILSLLWPAYMPLVTMYVIIKKAAEKYQSE